MKLLNNLKLVLGGVAVASIAACGGGGGGTAETGTLKLALTDAPACGYDAVNVTILKVRVHQSASASGAVGEGGWSEIDFTERPLHVDLLKLQNGDLAELGEVTLPTGSYNQMRLVLADNKTTPLANTVVLTKDQTVVELDAPSGSQSGVKAKQFKIDIGPNQLANFVIDFDACKSVVVAGNAGKYLLKPQLTVIPRYISGVKGSVQLPLVTGYTNVSLQQDGVAVKATAPDVYGNFLLPVAPGSYTLVMTALGRTTSVVTGVTVASEKVTEVTPLSTPPVSDTGILSGTAPVDTLVRVLQPLTLTSGNPASVEVAGQFVNGITGSYSYTVPVAAPRIASYVAAPNVLAFSPDTAAAGKYSVKASLTGFADKAAALVTPLAKDATITNNFTFP
ncbi:MAG: DUF4382 domain-containing protein [Polaromonas sp.]|nr:DUF4382 domain-containing protein [Polaromonas sp.]